MTQKLVPNPDPAIDFPPPGRPVSDYFPIDVAQPDADMFEIGLTLGGTVSAAAYTAGVLDFLIQALDAFTLAKLSGGPNHRVRIKIGTGASGGALSCALLARMLNSAFPHCESATPADVRARNPLYDCWVNEIDIVDMLQRSDLDRTGKLDALLNADKIDAVGTAIASYRGLALGTPGTDTPAIRDYVEPLLPLVLTLTNLRGVPYCSDFRGTSGRPEYYTDHADHIRYLVDLSGENAQFGQRLQPYETGISDLAQPNVMPWPVLIHGGRGSSAFPVGLPPQVVARDPQHYRYRYAVIDGEARWLRPAWPYMMPIGSGPTTPYQFLCVDGGCFNNEPTIFARQWIEGIQGDHVDDGRLSHRAVVLVDPFADMPDYGLVADGGIFASAGATISAWKSGGRFETADLDLFTAEDVYSRFLVNPVRTDANGTMLTGGDALATYSMAAFGGFLCRAFREHDFMLGRRNCQQFLRANFVLDQANSLFNGWTPGQRQQFGGAAPGFLPIVPLIGRLADEIPQPTWPKGAFQPSTIHDLLDSRLEKAISIETKPIVDAQSFIVRGILNLVIPHLHGMGTDQAIAAITDALKSADLL
jgi:hypothetical protein